MFQHVERSHDHVYRGSVPSIANEVLASPGFSLDRATRARFEPRLNYDFSRVRLHDDAKASDSAAALEAQAYTVGEHVVFGANRYRPQSATGDRLIEHELGHVVQQARSVARTSIQRDVLPVAKFSPAPGIFVDRTEHSIIITGAMELYGPEGTTARAAQIQNTINSTWTHTFPDGYSVSCNITVTYRGPGSSRGNATQIEALKMAGPSNVSVIPPRSMQLNANESDAFTWTPAHEFGHIIGLQDRYTESIVSSIKGTFGGERTTTAQPGYEKNLMAIDPGTLESQNIKDIASENEPSPYWINDDDQVRDWVNGHTLEDIRKLSTPNKLKAISTLMGGWISDNDVAAISRICASVTSASEANAIRKGVNVLDMTSIGQRTAVRVAFAKMP